MLVDDVYILLSSTSSSPTSSTSISSNINASSSSSSHLATIGFSNTAFSSSLLISSLFSDERICYLLKYETQNYGIINNNALSAVAAY